MALETRTLCLETRMNSTYFWEGAERKTRQGRKGDKAGLFTEGNNAARYGAMLQAESAMAPPAFSAVSRWERSS